MKKTASFVILIFLTSCGVKPIVSSIKPLFEVLTQQNDGGANIHFFEILSEEREIKMLQNDPFLGKNINSIDIKNSNFVILNMGEKPTAGYSISVEKVEETPQNIIIHVKESNPSPELLVTQNSTYPYCVVKINSKKEIVIK